MSLQRKLMIGAAALGLAGYSGVANADGVSPHVELAEQLLLGEISDYRESNGKRVQNFYDSGDVTEVLINDKGQAVRFADQAPFGVIGSEDFLVLYDDETVLRTDLKGNVKLSTSNYSQSIATPGLQESLNQQALDLVKSYLQK